MSEQADSLLAVLRLSFPLASVAFSSLSAHQHGALVSFCWEEQRKQLNGLKVLDVLEQQWEGAGRESERRRRDLKEAEEERIRPTANQAAYASSTYTATYTSSYTTTSRQTMSSRSQPPPSQRRKRRRREEEADGAELKEEAVEAAEAFSRYRPQGERRGGGGVGSSVSGLSTSQPWAQLPVEDEGLSDDDVPLSSAPPPIFRPASHYERPARRSWERSGSAGEYRGGSQHRGLPVLPVLPPLYPPVYRYSALTEYCNYPNHNSDDRCVDLSLLLTSYDCYVPGLTFVFGVARFFRAGVVSSHRLGLSSKAASSAFLHKEAVHEVGHLFGLAHCQAPCVMTFSPTVEAAYAKDTHLCPTCRWKLGWMESGVTVKTLGPDPHSGGRYGAGVEEEKEEEDEDDREEEVPLSQYRRYRRETAVELHSTRG